MIKTGDWLYPQYDLNTSGQSNGNVHRSIKVSVHYIDCPLKVNADLICSLNKGDDYEFFLV